MSDNLLKTNPVGPAKALPAEPGCEHVSEGEWIAQFEAGSLPNAAFHHRDHVRMAFFCFRQYPPLVAMERFSDALRNFAARNGKPELYHATITWAYLLLIQERMARGGKDQSWAEFARANGDLLEGQNQLLRKYYRAETIASPLARGTFVFPDNF